LQTQGLERERTDGYGEAPAALDTYSHVRQAVQTDAADRVAGLIFGRDEVGLQNVCNASDEAVSGQ